MILAIFAAPAHASYELVGSFRPSGNLELRDSEAAGAAVDETSGDLYIADPHNHRVERFSATGSFLGAWGWGVVNGAGEFQVCMEAGQCESEGLAGSEPGEFVAPEGIAVDQETGNVYVLDMGRTLGVVQEFSATGAFISVFGDRGNSTPAEIQQPAEERNDLAVGKDGNVYISDEGATHGPRVMVFSAAGTYEAGQDLGIGTLTAPGPVAADELGDLFTINGGCALDKLAPDDNLAWRNEESCERQSLAVNPATGISFVYSKSGDSFSELSPEGGLLGHFAGASGEAATKGLAFDPAATWSAGRPPGLLYAVNFNENEETDEVLIFSQPTVVPPTLGEASVSGVGDARAVLTAQINPNGDDTHYRFQYGSLGACSAPASECTGAPAAGEADAGAGQGRSGTVTLNAL